MDRWSKSLIIFVEIISLSGLCVGTSKPCQNEVKYPDKSSPYHYFPCFDGKVGPRTKCLKGSGACNNYEDPCIFDLQSRECTNPNSYRLMTVKSIGEEELEVKNISSTLGLSTGDTSTVTTDKLTTEGHITTAQDTLRSTESHIPTLPVVTTTTTKSTQTTTSSTRSTMFSTTKLIHITKDKENTAMTQTGGDYVSMVTSDVSGETDTSTSIRPATTTTPDGDALSGGAIAGIVIASVALTAGAIGIVFLYIKKSSLTFCGRNLSKTNEVGLEDI